MASSSSRANSRHMPASSQPTRKPLSHTYKGFRAQPKKNTHEQRAAERKAAQSRLAAEPQPHPDDVTLLPEVMAIEDEMVLLRRIMHMHPELLYEEVFTATLVATKLRSFGIEVTEKVGGTGVVGVLHGANPGRCIALRADMDALPLQETVDVSFKSRIDGKMHACGHDGHVAMLLGTAQVLARERHHLTGSVKFIFQPAEEGGAGALAMINDGVLENPHVDEIYGLHVDGMQQTYQMSICNGNAAAGSDSWRIEFEGRGGHGAHPEDTQDLVLAAANLTTQLNAVVPRNANALLASVLSVCRFDMGTTYNVIPAVGTLWGTLRTFHDYNRARLVERMEELIQGVCTGYEVTARLLFDGIGYPPMVNSYPEAYESTLTACEAVFGDQRIWAPAQPSMASEDFAYFLLERPGCFFRIGCSDTPIGYAQHSPDFVMDERCLVVGASVWVTLVRNLLGPQKDSPAAPEVEVPSSTPSEIPRPLSTSHNFAASAAPVPSHVSSVIPAEVLRQLPDSHKYVQGLQPAAPSTQLRVSVPTAGSYAPCTKPTSPTHACTPSKILRQAPSVRHSALHSSRASAASATSPTSPKPTVRICASCAKPHCSKMCSRCLRAFYCSNECQATDWRMHSRVCMASS